MRAHKVDPTPAELGKGYQLQELDCWMEEYQCTGSKGNGVVGDTSGNSVTDVMLPGLVILNPRCHHTRLL